MNLLIQTPRVPPVVFSRRVVAQIALEHAGERHGRQHAHHRRQRQHETDHHTGEIHRADGVQHHWRAAERLTSNTRHSTLDLKDSSRTEHALVADVSDAEPEACGEGAHQDVKIKEEGDPGGGLMLRYRRDDRNVNLGVAAHRKTCPRMTSRVETCACEELDSTLDAIPELNLVVLMFNT